MDKKTERPKPNVKVYFLVFQMMSNWFRTEYESVESQGETISRAVCPHATFGKEFA